MVAMAIIPSILANGIDTNNNISSLLGKEIRADVDISIFQTGLIEFFPRTTGFKARANAEGNYNLSIRNYSNGETLKNVTLESGNWYEESCMPKGIYLIIITLEDGRFASFYLTI